MSLSTSLLCYFFGEAKDRLVVRAATRGLSERFAIIRNIRLLQHKPLLFVWT
jgi:hypothetical protein